MGKILHIKKPTIKGLMDKEHEPDITPEPPRQILDRKHNVGINIISFEELNQTFYL